jgi:hypothetical protein
MSAYKQIKCEIVNKDLLVNALKALGLEPNMYESAVKLEGYHGEKREQKAEIIVTRAQLNKAFTGCSNDLGFAWNESDKKYDMMVSDYDYSCGIEKRVKQAYAKEAVVKALGDKKFNIKEITSNDNLRQRTRTKVTIKASRLI